MSINLDPTSPLAPSELILLNGEKFARKASRNSTYLLDNKTKLLAEPLAEVIVATAILANENVGAIRLEIQKGATLAIFPTTRLLAISVKGDVIWPIHSLERHILSAGKNGSEVYKIIYDWLRQDSDHPWSSVVEHVKEGMAKRQLLNIVKKKVIGIIPKKQYELPESTITLAAQQSTDAIEQLLAECKQTRMELWGLLLKQITCGVTKRQEYDPPYG